MQGLASSVGCSRAPTQPCYRPRMSMQETLPRPCEVERWDVGASLVVGLVQARLG